MSAVSKLTKADLDRFEMLEQICINGRLIWMMVGKAMTEIKDHELYTAKGFKNFAEYAESIGYSRRHADQLILSTEIVEALPKNLQAQISSERAVRELARISPHLRAPVIHAVTEGGTKPATSSAIRRAIPARPTANTAEGGGVKPRQKPIPARNAKSGSAGAKTVSEPVERDGTGIPVPKESLKLWNRGEEVTSFLAQLKQVQAGLELAKENKDPLFSEVDLTDDIALLKQIYVDVKTAIPYAVCPSCNGKTPEEPKPTGCPTCKRRGFVSQFYWDKKVPAQTKKVTGRE